MDSRLIFLRRPIDVTTPAGTVERNDSGHVDRPSTRVGQPRRASEWCVARQTASIVESTRKKSCLGELIGRPYRKPTQVGKASSLR